jgi:hypothetical protein
MAVIGPVGPEEKRYLRLLGCIEQRWQGRDPARFDYLKGLLDERYISTEGALRCRARTCQEVLQQEWGRLRRSRMRRSERRERFLAYVSLAGDEGEIDLEHLDRIGIGMGISNRDEWLLFSFEHSHADRPLMVLFAGGPFEDGSLSRRPPIEIGLADAYWWCTTGEIHWFDGAAHELRDEHGYALTNYDGCRELLPFSGPSTGRIEAWRKGGIPVPPPASSADTVATSETAPTGARPPDDETGNPAEPAARPVDVEERPTPEPDERGIPWEPAGYLDVILDHNEQAIGRAGTTTIVKLTSKNVLWNLLLDLLKSETFLIPKERLRDRWESYGGAPDPEITTIQDAISELRRLIADLDLVIENVRHRGYRLMGKPVSTESPASS